MHSWWGPSYACMHACMYVCMYVCRAEQGRSIVRFRVHSAECVALTRANEPETRAASPATLHVVAAQGMQRASATLCLVYVDVCMCVHVVGMEWQGRPMPEP